MGKNIELFGHVDTSNLSCGEQQRVAIARSIASGAKILLADESTGNLDKANGNKLMDILGRLVHKWGYCVIIVTHDHGIAEQRDKTWLMWDGFLS